jgi:MFS family permease
MISGLLHDVRRVDKDVLRHLFSMGLLGATLEGGLNSVVFNLYLLRLGYDAAWIGFISAVGTAVFGLACIPIGRLSVRFGLVRTMRTGMLLILFAALLIPLAG